MMPSGSIGQSGGLRRGGRAVLSLVLCVFWAEAVIAGPPGKTASDLAVQAHRAVQSAVVEVRHTPYFSYVEETDFATSSYRIVLDRAASRVRIDRPGFTLVSDGTDILLMAESLTGRHLRMPLNGPLTFERLVEVFPDLANPLPPALVMLLSKEPMAVLSGGLAERATPLAPRKGDPDRRHMQLPVALGDWQIAFEAQSRLMDELLLEIADEHVAFQDVEAVRFHYTFEWTGVDEPVDGKAFELNLKTSQEFTTLSAFLSPPGHGGGAAGGRGGQGGGVQGGGTLIGLPLPDVSLPVLGKDEKLKLSELDKGVVLLEFYASWAKASTLDLPALADFKAWCREQGHDVAVYPVAVGDPPEAMTKWLAALEKTAGKKIDLPVLMDTEMKAAMAFNLPTVPRTLVVVDGRIVEVYGGVKPTFLEDLKKGLPEWLEKVKEQEPEEPKREEPRPGGPEADEG